MFEVFLTFTSLVLATFPSIFFCLDELLLLLLLSLLLLLLDFKEDDWLIVLFRDSCLESFWMTGVVAGEGRGSFSLIVLCFDDLWGGEQDRLFSLLQT